MQAKFDREERKTNHPELIEEQRALTRRNMNLDSYKGQLTFYSKMYGYLDSKRRGKVITMDDIQKRIDEETAIRNNAKFEGGVMTDSERLGIQCLDLTNKFRAAPSKWHTGSLPMLSWSKQLHDIALQHSMDMADGKVPLSHEGF